MSASEILAITRAQILRDTHRDGPAIAREGAYDALTKAFFIFRTEPGHATYHALVNAAMAYRDACEAA